MGDDVLLIYLIIGVILIFVVLGILIWAVASMFKRDETKTGKADKKPGQTQGSLSDQRTAESQALVSAGPQLHPPTESENQDPELLRVYRDGKTGAIYIEIDGKQYRHLTDIHDPKAGRLLLHSVAELGRFTRGVTPAVTTKPAALPAEPQTKKASLIEPHKDAKSHETPESQLAPQPGSLAKRGEALVGNSQSAEIDPGTTPSQASTLLERVYKISDAPRTSGKTPVPEIKRPDPALSSKKAEQKITMGAFWGRMLSSPGSSQESTGPRPLADELEDILRGIIDNAPEEVPRNIHFKTAADGRLVIEVDGISHEEIGHVDDPLARQIIQAVIKKWEKK